MVRRIDTIFVRGASIADARVAPPWGSDHLGVAAEIAVSDTSP
jgi:endonuclease/exonuclease/phosphatase (EEP) superfamily protein YafD